VVEPSAAVLSAVRSSAAAVLSAAVLSAVGSSAAAVLSAIELSAAVTSEVEFAAAAFDVSDTTSAGSNFEGSGNILGFAHGAIGAM